MPSQEQECFVCYTMHEQNKGIFINENGMKRFVCDHCADSHLTKCDHCGEIHTRYFIKRCYENNQLKIICKDCINKGLYVYCEECSTYFANNECFYYDHLGYGLCKRCIHDYYNFCGECNTLRSESDYRNVMYTHSSGIIKNKNVCYDCLNEYKHCNYCDCYFSPELIEIIHEQRMCVHCKKHNVVNCDFCGEQSLKDLLMYVDSYKYYCEKCSIKKTLPFYKELNSKKCMIQNYTFKPKYIHFTGNNKKSQFTYGFELEIENNSHSITNEYMAFKLWKVFNNDFLHFKHDSSIVNGFEIVSKPFTRKWFNKNRKLFKKMYDLIKNNGFRTKINCGFHIHMNKKLFKSHTLLYKYLRLHYDNFDFIYKISQRNVNELVQYALETGNTCQCSWSIEKIRKMPQYEYIKRAKEKYTSTHESRYTTINLNNLDTIENRIFQATLSFNDFQKNLEFVESTYFYCLNTPISKISVKDFKFFIRDNANQYKHLYDFMVKTFKTNMPKIKKIKASKKASKIKKTNK